MSRSGTLVLAALLALGSLGPIASAGGPLQATVTVTADEQRGFIEPGSTSEVARLTVQLHTVGPLAEDIDVHLEPLIEHSGPGEWNPRVTPNLVTFEANPTATPDRGAGYTYEEEVVVRVSPGPHVPAFITNQLRIEPEPDHAKLYDVEAAGTAVAVTADWRPALEVEHEDPDLDAVAGDSIHVSADVHNFGNGPAKVTYEAVETPPGCAIDPIRPSLELERRSSRRVVFHLVCDEGAEDGPLTLRFDHRYAPDESLEPGEPVTTSWNVDVQDSASVQTAGLATSSPAWGAAAVLLGAIGVAIRRWRG